MKVGYRRVIVRVPIYVPVCYEKTLECVRYPCLSRRLGVTSSHPNFIYDSFKAGILKLQQSQWEQERMVS